MKQSSSEGVVECAVNSLYYRFLKRFLFCHCFDNVYVARKQTTPFTATRQWQSCVIWCDRKSLVCSEKLMDEIFIFHNVEYEYFIHMDLKTDRREIKTELLRRNGPGNSRWRQLWLRKWVYTHNCFTALFPGRRGWAGVERELLDFMVQGKM